METNPNMITYCELKNSFGENGLKNKKTINAYEYATWMLETNRSSSRYEIIKANKLAKLYFDVEKLPISENTNHKMIYEIRDAIANFFQSRLNKSIGKCIITHNKGSETHPGASYHLIFDQTISYTPIMREFVKEFVEKHP